ncbi:MAG: DUF1501 domain-containing protein [Planctomycetes bacterium]|nr:DUF1501 domain-containing protein [Planctomycetota bacterium]
MLPHTAGIVDDLTLVKSVHTNAINHDPACTFVMTGSELPGKARIRSWLAYELGSDNDDLSAFVVFTPRFPATGNAQAIYSRMWGSGFLPTWFSGVTFRGSGDPVLCLDSPAGVKAGTSSGETDDFSYNVVAHPVHINDFNATILHLMGIDHERFTTRFQRLDQRLNGVEPQRVVTVILAEGPTGRRSAASSHGGRRSAILPAPGSHPMPAPVTIVWFRHDLRLDDNPALVAAAARGAVVPVFIWAPDEEAPWEPGAASRWWLYQSLERLAAALAKAGAPLVIRRGPSVAALRSLAKEHAATHVVWNRRYEPAVVKRDTAIKQALINAGLVAESHNGGLLFEPVHVRTKEGRPYQVFTPFWRALLALPEPAAPMSAPRRLVQAAAAERPSVPLEVDDLGLLPEIDWASTMAEIWAPGEAGGTKRLSRFLERALAGYGTGRDRPDQDGTSGLSPHLHFGEVSPRRVWHAVREAVGGKPAAKIAGSPEVFLRELGWREFASHLLFHFPHTSDAPLRADYARFPWATDPVGLRAWQRGRTGFPVVDAGMRQLWATGWMHNRVRMIVASFLVKDLRVNWLTGARWFWDTLVDADLAANTLGWQWAAGCGADAAPYFRIFNPRSQGEKFDPDGGYVRRWVPALGTMPAADIHAPAEAEATVLAKAAVQLGRDYPEPIVDHAEARKLALEALKKVSRSPSR